MYRSAQGIYFAEIIYPSSSFDYDIDITNQLDSLKSNVEKNLLEASYCLFQFENVRSLDAYDENYRKKRAIRDDRYYRKPIEEAYWKEKGTEEHEPIKDNFEILRRETRWFLDQGILPNSYISNQKYFYAKNFALCFDRIGAILRVTKKIQNVIIDSKKYEEHLEEFLTEFKYSKDIRDAISHPEHRARELDRKGLKIVGEPDTFGMFEGQSPSVFHSSNLSGNNLIYTNEKGSHVTISISCDSIIAIESIIQGCIECLKYRHRQGMKSHFPMI